ncbi:hypothetical protein GH714_022617 [Hevea brasiliensis]|uniref:UBA domain-containing protein n=1 Tax=Hevea brasiliensis TaxID=3981 RepID=A0A6A6KLK3_HEVBR|nr:hypothetical protein GH714_022617 [Hevea brasiliensis]
MAGVSLKCGDCGALLKSVLEAQEHAELTSHSNFYESTEAVLNLVCTTCGKPCRSKTESDLHTKRTGHTDFVDKTSEAAKPTSLEVPKPPLDVDEPVDASTSSQPEEMVAPEVDQKLLEELEGMGFPKARATRAIHYSGNASVEAAVNWVVEHENDPDIDEMPLAERRRKLGLPPEDPATVKPSPPVVEEKKSSLPVRPATKTEQMRECLRIIKQTHKDDDAKVKRAFQTLLTYIGNVAKNPNEDKYRKIRVNNQTFQEIGRNPEGCQLNGIVDRVGSLKGGIEFLELCGFEKIEGDEFLFLPRDKVDMAVLNSAGSELNSAINNPFFGVL